MSLKQLKIPEPLKYTETKAKKWYEKYKKLPSVKFTYENSGRRGLQAPPYHARHDDNLDVIDIDGLYGMNQRYKIVGYTENPPFTAPYPCIAIMFEDLNTFEKIWWHYGV